MRKLRVLRFFINIYFATLVVQFLGLVVLVLLFRGSGPISISSTWLGVGAWAIYYTAGFVFYTSFCAIRQGIRSRKDH